MKTEIEIVLIGVPTSPSDILNESFQNVAHAVYDIGLSKPVHTSSVPNLYKLAQAVPTPVNLVRSLVGMHTLWTVKPIQGLGLTEDQSLTSLYVEAAEAAMSRNLFLLEPKQGQEEIPVVVGKPYEIIRQSSARHDHSSPRLADFACVYFHPALGFHKDPIAGDRPHTHFWLK